jgi:hypothetical protein
MPFKRGILILFLERWTIALYLNSHILRDELIYGGSRENSPEHL